MEKQLFIKQRDQTDCGVACLLSVIRHYGGDTTIELLREQSGTSVQGTSLLGLQQAAGVQNLQSDAFEVEDLEVFKREATFPCILHVTIDNQLEHYVVCLKTPPQPSATAAAPTMGREQSSSPLPPVRTGLGKGGGWDSKSSTPPTALKRGVKSN